MLHQLNVAGKSRRRTADCGTHGVSVFRQCRDHGAADKSGGSCDQDATHFLPCAKTTRSQVTRMVPAMSATMPVIGPGINTVVTDRTPRPMLTANTRVTMPMVVKPLSVAR